VDIVLEQGAHAVAGIEVKAAATVTAADFGGLRKLKAAAVWLGALGYAMLRGPDIAAGALYHSGR
jgi:hypothetical protein